MVANFLNPRSSQTNMFNQRGHLRLLAPPSWYCLMGYVNVSLTGCCRRWWSCDTCWRLACCGRTALGLDLSIRLFRRGSSVPQRLANLKNGRENWEEDNGVRTKKSRGSLNPQLAQGKNSGKNNVCTVGVRACLVSPICVCHCSGALVSVWRLTCGVEGALVHVVNPVVQQSQGLIEVVCRSDGWASGSSGLLQEAEDIVRTHHVPAHSTQTPDTRKGQKCFNDSQIRQQKQLDSLRFMISSFQEPLTLYFWVYDLNYW